MAKTVVIVGGGVGGSIVASHLAKRLHHEIHHGEVVVNLLTEADRHLYQPGLLYVALGQVEPSELIRKETDVVQPGVNVIVDPVVKIDKAANAVHTKSGKVYNYDYLVIATGSRPMPELIPGLAEAGHWFYTEEGALKLRKALHDFEGGKIVVAIGVPHKCPVAPLEITLMLEESLKARGLRDKTEILYTYPIGRTHSLEPVAHWATPEFDRRGIKYETLFNMKEVDVHNKEVHSIEGSSAKFDLLITIPPHRGMSMLTESGLADQGGWVPVDRNTLRVAETENVWALGDTTNLPISKAGSTAHYEADTVAEQLIGQLNGLGSGKRYDGKVFCFIETGGDKATYITFDYNHPPKPAPPSTMIHWFKLAYNRIYWLNPGGVI